MKNVGEPGAGEPHARFDGRELEKEPAKAADHGGPRETEGPEPGGRLRPVTSPAPYPTNLNAGVIMVYIVPSAALLRNEDDEWQPGAIRAQIRHLKERLTLSFLFDRGCLRRLV